MIVFPPARCGMVARRRCAVDRESATCVSATRCGRAQRAVALAPVSRATTLCEEISRGSWSRNSGPFQVSISAPHRERDGWRADDTTSRPARCARRTTASRVRRARRGRAAMRCAPRRSALEHLATSPSLGSPLRGGRVVGRTASTPSSPSGHQTVSSVGSDARAGRLPAPYGHRSKRRAIASAFGSGWSGKTECTRPRTDRFDRSRADDRHRMFGRGSHPARFAARSTAPKAVM